MTTILIVDDNEVDRKVLRRMVERVAPAMSTVVEASSARSALDVAERRPPDVVFLDLVLEGGPGGLHALAALRKVAPQALILVATGLPRDHPRVQAALKNGAADHLMKPVVLDAVRLVLRD